MGRRCSHAKDQPSYSWGNVAASFQNHAAAATTSDPSVQYAYAKPGDTGSGNSDSVSVRLSKVTYPNGREVFYNYGSAGSIGDVLNRIDNIAASATPADADIFAQYAYLGAGTVVRVTRPDQADALTLDYDPDADHTYAGWDRFGRVVNQQWTNATGTTTFDQYAYTYDIAGNRTTRTNALNSDLSETYTYDELSRLIDTDRGEGEQQANFQSWELDQLGNWTTFCGPIQYTQTREHNEANEITSVSGGGPQPAYDATGNMIYFADARDSTPDSLTPGMNAVYDAWNRMVKVYADDGATAGQLDAGDSPIAVYEYDGQRRRIEKTVYEDGEVVATTGTYFNENWQAVEERATDLTVETGGESTTQYLWDIRYIDSPVVRFLDANADGDLVDAGDGVVYYVNDANWNVTALMDGMTGAVVERYSYEGYGNQTVLEADWSPDADNASDVGNTRGFSGAVRDAETGLVLMRWRYTHPSLGRFTSVDPVKDGVNWYEYCAGDPVVHVDPLGLIFGCSHEETPAPNGWWVAKDQFLSGYSGGGGFTASLWETTVGSQKSHCVLYVTIKSRFFFGDGKHGQPFVQGGWEAQEREAFIQKWKAQIWASWQSKYSISLKGESDATNCKCCAGTEVRIDLDTKDLTDTSTATTYKRAWDEWVVYVVKAPIQDSVGIAGDMTSNLSASSVDIIAGRTQPVAAHEFGHMLGLNDEYKKPHILALSYNYTRPWTGDTQSIMNVGGAVRPRHYVPFAMWMDKYTPQPTSGKCSYGIADEAGKVWDAMNSGLHGWLNEK